MAPLQAIINNKWITLNGICISKDFSTESTCVKAWKSCAHVGSKKLPKKETVMKVCTRRGLFGKHENVSTCECRCCFVPQRLGRVR